MFCGEQYEYEDQGAYSFMEHRRKGRSQFYFYILFLMLKE